MNKHHAYLSIAAALLINDAAAMPQTNHRFRYVSYPSLNFQKKEQQAQARELDEILESLPTPYYSDSTAMFSPAMMVFDGYVSDPIPETLPQTTLSPSMRTGTAPAMYSYTTPQWLSEGIRLHNSAKSANTIYMSSHPQKIDYMEWELPEPPELMALPGIISPSAAKDIPQPAEPAIPETRQEMIKRHWLHNAGASVQFSQAYVSPNWYQGGENNVTLLVNGLWNVKLNQVYHPTLLFESNMQYKLGLYSTPNDDYHSYSISEDIFQWNVTAGLKAFKKWYYSYNMQFKTQLLNNYGSNSVERKAAFLSPGEMNMGVGMTYSTENKKKTVNFKASIAPISYNLKMCMNEKVDPTLFNIPEGKKYTNEIGSSAELTLTCKLSANISYNSRMFLFSNYKYFTGDWENTFNFAINRFLSTQIYVHGRFDTSVNTESKGWKKWMLKEILSFGFSYSFSTVPSNK